MKQNLPNNQYNPMEQPLENNVAGAGRAAPICSGSSLHGEWYDIAVKQPEPGQIVTLFHSHRQVRQAVCAPEYGGGFKMPNCAGWECVGEHWGWMWSPQYVPDPERSEIRARFQNETSPSVDVKGKPMP